MIVIQAGKILSKQFISLSRSPSSIQSFVILQRFESTTKCEKPKTSWKLLTASTLALAGTGLAIYVAKHDENVREWSRENFPALDDMVKVVYQEEKTYPQFLYIIYRDLTDKLKDALYNIYHGLKEAGQKVKEPAIEQRTVIKKVQTYFNSPKSAFIIEDNRNIPENMKHLKELEDTLFRNAQEAMKIHNSLIKTFNELSSFIENLSEFVSKHECIAWERYSRGNEELKELSFKFDEGVKKVQDSANYLQFQIDKTSDLPLEVKRNAEDNISYTVDTVETAKNNLREDQKKPKLSNDKLKMSRMYFSSELENFFPNVWSNVEKLTLPSENMPPFIEHVIQKIKTAEKDLSKLQAIQEEEINNAIDLAINGDPKQTETLVNVVVNIEKEKEKRLQREELQKALQTNNAKYEKDNKEALKKLSEVYSDLKNEALATCEREVERKMEQQIDQSLADLRSEHQLEMAKMVGRIQGTNEAIASRDKQDKSHQKKQQFWSAAQNLLSAVSQIGNNSQEQKPLINEILNVTRAAPEGDELVKTVVDTIPSEIIEQGVMSEECLKRRFLQVERTARHLAAVQDTPVTLVQLALARVESAFYIDLPIPESELNNEPIDSEKLNNYQLLQRARYYVDEGDLGQAVKYLNLLKGHSSQVASGWAQDVTNHLVMLQAAQVLFSYASMHNQS